MEKLPYYIPIKTNCAPGNKERVEKKSISSLETMWHTTAEVLSEHSTCQKYSMSL